LWEAEWKRGEIPADVLTAEGALDQRVAGTAALPALGCGQLKRLVQVCVRGTIGFAVVSLFAAYALWLLVGAEEGLGGLGITVRVVHPEQTAHSSTIYFVGMKMPQWLLWQ